MGNLRCPVCHHELKPVEQGLGCEKNHRFDRAASGYVNLGIGSKQRKSGDEKQMIQARSRFLNQGYYEPLLVAIGDMIQTLNLNDAVDLGCGEGYYTHAFALRFPRISWTGIDLSTEALKHAAKLNRNIRYVASSISDVPLMDESADLALNIFAPIFPTEIKRILRIGKYAILVLPHTDHLYELKQHLYSNVLLNPEPLDALEGLGTYDYQDVRFTMHLDSQASIQDLLGMTPYVHRSPKEGLERVANLAELKVRASFRILCVTKTDK